MPPRILKHIGDYVRKHYLYLLAGLILIIASAGYYAYSSNLILKAGRQDFWEQTKTALGDMEIKSVGDSSKVVAALIPVPTFTPTPKPISAVIPTPTPTPRPPQPTTLPPTANTPPGSGYSRVQANTSAGTFTVDIITADLNSTRIVVDTASDSDCSNNCPAMSVGSYASRSGAYAAINGSYFCPQEYPGCAGKTNSFDTLLMNKNKVYFNSVNNVYSTVPAVIFSGSGARFVGQSLEWGRDTGVDAVLANYPLLLSGGQIVYGGSSDPKLNSIGPRGFVATSGSTVYIGVVARATMSGAAEALKALGIQNALNLDEGGSTALWHGGRYILGPGRNVPNALLFIQK